MLLRVLVGDLTVEDTGAYKTAINQRTTASAELGIDYRILGGSPDESAVFIRMGLRSSEGDQMPPIGTEMTDATGLALISSFIEGLTPPPPL
jgi:hypothetical protein